MKFAVISLALLAIGCTDAGWAGSVGSLNKSHHVKQYSGGQLVGEWDSTGKVLNEDRSDGYHFVDKKTGKLIRISGDLQITIND